MTATQVHGTPARIEVTAQERLLIGFDFGPRLEAGETVTLAVALLRALATQQSYAAGLDGAPQVDGATVRQWVHQLERGQVYRLEIDATTSTGRVIAMLVDLAVVN